MELHDSGHCCSRSHSTRPRPPPHYSIPSSLLPSSSSQPSPFLSTLLKTSRSHLPSPAPPAHAFAPSRGQAQPLDHLAWSGSTLTWTRDGAVYRTFSYEHEGVANGGERVTQALFADFEAADSSPLASTSTRTPSSSSKDSLFGPYAAPPSTSWPDSPLPLPSHPPSSIPPPSSPSCPDSPPALKQRRQRVLLVFLSSIAFAYPLSNSLFGAGRAGGGPGEGAGKAGGGGKGEAGGGRTVVPLPIRVKRAFALDAPHGGGGGGGGVLIERAREGREVWAKGGEGAGEGAGEGGRKGTGVPTWWTLTGLMEELKPVCSISTEEGELAFSASPSLSAPAAALVSGPQTPLRDLDEHILHVAASPPSPSSNTPPPTPPTPPILVTASPSARLLRIYAYAREGGSPSPATLSYRSSSGSTKEKGKGRAAEPSAPAAPAPAASAPGAAFLSPPPPPASSSSPILTRSGLSLSTASTTASALNSVAMRPSLSGTKRKYAPDADTSLLNGARAGSRSTSPLSPDDGGEGDERGYDRRRLSASTSSAALGPGPGLGGPAYPSSLPGRPRSSLTRLASFGGQALALAAEGQEQELLLEAGRSFSGLGPALGLGAGPEAGAGAGGGRKRHPPGGGDRRVSLTRLPPSSSSLGAPLSGGAGGAGGQPGPGVHAHELSVTMDRMALSQGSNASTVMSLSGLSFSGPPALGMGGLGGMGGMGAAGLGEREREWGEIEREDLGGAGEETRIFGAMGGEGGEGEGMGMGGAKGAEVVVKLLWEGEVDGLDDSTAAHVFDVCASYLSPSTPSPPATCATLAVHLPSTSSLLLFSLSSTPSTSAQQGVTPNPTITLSATPLRSLPAPVLSCTPVLATRRRTGVRDLLVLTSSSSPPTDADAAGKRLALLTARGAELPVSFSAGDFSDVVSLEGGGGTEVVLSRADGSARRASFAPASSGHLRDADGDDAEEELAGKCLAALAEVLGLEDFTRLLGSVLERERECGKAGGRGGKMGALEEVLDEVFGVDAEKGKGKANEGDKGQGAFEAFLAAQAQGSSASSSSRDPITSLLRPLPSLSLPAPSPASASTPAPTPSQGATLSPQQSATLLALHLVAQDLSLLSSPCARAAARRVGGKVAQWSGRVGLGGWVDAYERTLGGLGSAASSPLPPAPTTPPSFPLTPPLLLPSLLALLSAPPATAPKVAAALRASFLLSSVADAMGTGTGDASGFYGQGKGPLEVTEKVLELYASLTTSPSTSSSTSSAPASTTTRAHRTVALLHSFLSPQPSPSSPPSAPSSAFSFSTLSSLSFALALPLREALRMAQLDPPEPGSDAAREAGWVGVGEGGKARGCFAMVGRGDLERQVEGDAGGRVGGQERKEGGKVGIDEIVKAALGQAPARAGGAGAAKDKAGGGEKKTTLAVVPKAERFSEDKRLEEVERMLQYEEAVVISAGERTLDQLTPQIQQSILLALSQRTLALPIGQGMFSFRTRAAPAPSATSSASTDDPSPFSISKLNTSARIIPMPSPVALVEKDRGDPSNPPTTPDRFEWPDFHSGVVSALQMRFDRSSSSTSVDSSQISFNRPADLDAAHAGLLFGLGLAGQLGAMLSSQAYEYLKAKHDPTSVGLLLGLAVNYLATADPTVTSVVSIHLPALHPPRSSSLNVSGMTQAAAAVALGLVHFGTGRRSYADVLLNELCGVKVTTVEDAAACREAYALSCGFGFGMIMLGQGREKKSAAAATGAAALDGIGGEKEVEHLRIFRTLILGGYGGSSGAGSTSSGSIDTSITSPAATIALALTYLRSHRADVAAIVALPDTPRALDYVRHDLLLLRTVARALIMWDETRKGKDWVEGCLPAFLNEATAQAAKTGRPMDGDLEVARWSIVAGACFAIGLKFAGTAAAEAHATLIHFLDRLTRASYAKTSSVQGKIKRHALRSCLGALTLALSMVMAGTGEINVLRRLRVAHGLFSEGMTYGSHVATHMALGLLFLGRGQYTLGTSDAAIAALLIALYPAFPSASTENRGHLQAFRHLWVLAVEPRYLDARDVDTGEPVFLPVKLRLADSADGSSSTAAAAGGKTELRSKQLVAPTLIPDLRHIDSIHLDSPRYWSFSLRLAQNPQHLARFLASPTLYVKRRTGHLSYAQDPRGIRSIFTRSKSETGSSVFDLGEMGRMLSASSSGLRDFVAAFSGLDAEAVAATRELCHPGGGLPSAFEAFAASALLECLTKDKRDVFGVYLAFFAAATALDKDALLRPGPGGADLLSDAAQLQFAVSFYKNGAFKALFSKPKPASSSSSKTSSSSSGQVSRDPLISPAFIDHLSLRLSSLTTDLLASDSIATALRGYLTNPDSSPSSSSSSPSTALSFVLSSLRIPPAPVLAQLKDLMRRTASDQRFGPDQIAVVLRAVGRKMAEQQLGIGADGEGVGAGAGAGGGGKKGGKAASGGKVGSAWEREAERWMVECWVPAGPSEFDE